MKRISQLTPLLALIVSVACNTKEGRNEELPFEIAEPGPSPASQPGPQPIFTTTASLETAPPPISGGTLTIAPDGRTAVAADPDRDRIYVVDLPSRTVNHSIKLADGAEPGRVAIDDSGRAHVALRRTGNVATVDLKAGTVTERHVCAAPRGLAYDASIDTLHVACAEGVLVSVPLATGELKRVPLDGDLRDVVITRKSILVSRFRQADVLELSREGVYRKRSTTRGGNLAWRMTMFLATPPPSADGGEVEVDEQDDDDQPALLSQEPTNPSFAPGETANQPGAYGGATRNNDACSASTITSARLDLPGRDKILIPPAVLPVDLATNGSGNLREYAIVAAGNGHTPDLPQIFVHTSALDSRFTEGDCSTMQKGFVPGQAVAAAFDGDNQLIVQSREPAALYIMSPDRQRVMKEIMLSDESREDTGHAIFHSNSGGFIACASCHAEGGDDGRTWIFPEGERRTPSMRGTLVNTAPFHWDGAMKDLRMLVDNVLTVRMSGPKVNDAQLDTLKGWLFRQPSPPKLERDADAVARGQAIFAQRCTACHSGPELTNNESRDVGTGGTFQVPSLIGVAWRAPFLHNGCATTLADRFGPCGGTAHGDVSDLDKSRIKDLTTYLESL